MANILLVDDNDLFCEAIQKLLATKGHNVIAAKSGKFADELQRRTTAIELVISDIKMPDLDGRDLTRRIRARSPIPVILITGFSEIAETLDAFEVGANAFIAKPFQSRELIETIDECLTEKNHPPIRPDSYCSLDIDEFTHGREIKFPIFVRLSPDKYAKIAHSGEDMSPDRIESLKEKGVMFLYLREKDFLEFEAESIR
jgi:CheY-like chemotaxis protein